MERIIITLASKDVAVLDATLKKTASTLPLANSTIHVISAVPALDGKIYRRKIILFNISQKELDALVKLDFPDTVSAAISVES